jgi:hypothetical protein
MEPSIAKLIKEREKQRVRETEIIEVVMLD